MKESIELMGRDIKIAYLLPAISIVSLIFALLGFWAGIHQLFGLNAPTIALPALFILGFALLSLIVFLISMWSTSLEIEFSEVDEAKDVKHETKKEKEKESPEHTSAMKGRATDVKVEKGDTFEVREAEFLESPAYQYLFDYVKRIIQENNISIYWKETDIEDLLLNSDRAESNAGEEVAEDGLEKWGLNQLRLFLAKKRFYFSEKEFKTLIENEIFRQTYEDFKKYVHSRNPQKPDDIILSFLEFVREEEYPQTDNMEVIQKFINGELDVTYLKKILEEKNVMLTEEDLIEEIRRVGEGVMF